jgi:hypothetical protein
MHMHTAYSTKEAGFCFGLFGWFVGSESMQSMDTRRWGEYETQGVMNLTHELVKYLLLPRNIW